MTMIKEAIDKVVQHGDLSYDEAYQTMGEIMRGETTPTQNAAFLAALSTKNTRAETIEEISGCACAMREIATPVEHPGVETLEIVGTGGDRSNTFNISTAPRRAPRSPSTATGRPAPRAARPTAWRPWVSTWTRTRARCVRSSTAAA